MVIKCIFGLAVVFAIVFVAGFFIPTSSVRIVMFEKNKIIPIDLSRTTHVRIRVIDKLKVEEFDLVIEYQNGSEVRLTPMSEYREEKSFVFKIPKRPKEKNSYNLAMLVIPDNINLKNSEITVASRKSFNLFLCERFSQVLMGKQ